MADLQCPECLQSFSRLDNCYNHVRTHKTSAKPCVVRGCRQSFRRLARHLKGKHKWLCQHPCGECSKVFVRECDLRLHSKAKHSGKIQSVLNQRRVDKIPTGNPNNLLFLTSNRFYQNSRIDCHKIETIFKQTSSPVSFWLVLGHEVNNGYLQFI